MLKLFQKKNCPQYLYSEEEVDEYEQYIVRSYGEYKTVLHELFSPDIHLDVIPVPPTEDAPYYKLITMGAGAYRMKIPKEYDSEELRYAEYVLYLPPDWNLSSAAPEDYWPIGMLKTIARLPIECRTWLGYGHSVHGNADTSPFASNTKLNSFLLVSGLRLDGEVSSVRLSSGKYINFYQLIPLYQEELDLKLKNGTSALLDLFPDEENPPVLHINRSNFCLP